MVNWLSVGSDDGLSPIWCQAIVQASAELLSIRIGFSGILIKEQIFSLAKMHLKISSAR